MNAKQIPEAESVVSVHVLPDTSPEKRNDVIDGGRFIDDLGAYGLTLALTNRQVYETGDVLIPRMTEDTVEYEPHRIAGGDQIDAMHVRTLSKITRAGSENIPKLNPNELKEFAGSKIELYRRALSEYQVPTELLDMNVATYETMLDIIDSIDTGSMVIKSNSGFGGHSTRMFEKKEALEWMQQQLGEEKPKKYLVQPKIIFGALPDGIEAIGSEDNQALVRRARTDGLLSELRMFAIKRGDNVDTVPVLRVVPDKNLPMSGSNDDYIDVALPDDLHTALREVSQDIMLKVTAEAGDVPYALGAIDYYFDADGIPRVMEANFRSPQLPLTRDNPEAGRKIHTAVARTLAEMAQTRKNI